MRDDSAELLFQSFLLAILVSSSGMGRDVQSLMFSISISSADHSITHLRGALKDGFGEAVVACDMPEPGRFLSLDSCQKKVPSHSRLKEWEPLSFSGGDLQFRACGPQLVVFSFPTY